MSRGSRSPPRSSSSPRSSRPHPAAAQASREGASFTAAGPWGTVRLPDVVVRSRQRGLPDRLGQPDARGASCPGRRPARRAVRRADGGLAQSGRPRRLQPRPGRVPGRLVRHARQPERLPGVGPARPPGPERRPALHRAGLLHRRPDRRRQRRARSRRRLRHGLAPLPRRVSPDRAARRHRRPARRQHRRAARRPAAAVRGQPLAARTERRLQPQQRHVHGGVGPLLQPGRPGRGARPHRRRRDRRARRGPRDRHRHRRLRAAARVQPGPRPVLRRLVHAAERLRPPHRGRRHAARQPVDSGVQLRDLRRPRPVLQRAADAYFAVFHGRGREDAGAQVSAAGVPDGGIRRHRDHGPQRQLQPAHHQPHRPRRVADRHLERLRPAHRAAHQVSRRCRPAAPAAATAAPAAPAADDGSS